MQTRYNQIDWSQIIDFKCIYLYMSPFIQERVRLQMNIKAIIKIVVFFDNHKHSQLEKA